MGKENRCHACELSERNAALQAEVERLRALCNKRLRALEHCATYVSFDRKVHIANCDCGCREVEQLFYEIEEAISERTDV